MEDLFRFNIVREAVRSSDEIDPIDLAANSRFQSDAAAIPNGAARRTQLKALAANFIKSPRFIKSIATNPNLMALEEASTSVDTLIEKEKFSRAELEAVLTPALGGNPATFVSSPQTRGRMTAIRDSILAIKLSPPDHHRPLRRFAAILRAFELAQRFVTDPGFPADASSLIANHRRTMRIPGAVLPSRPPSVPRPVPLSLEDKLTKLSEKHNQINLAIKELKGVRPGGFSISKQKVSKAKLPPEKFRPLKLFEQEHSVRQMALRATLLSSGADILRPPAAGDPANIAIGRLGTVQQALPGLRSETLSAETPGFRLGQGARIALTGRPGFNPVLPGLAGLRLTEATRRGLSRTTLAVLKTLDLSPSDPISRTLKILATERRRIFEQSQALIQPTAQKTFKKIGGVTVSITSSPLPFVYALPPHKILLLLPGLFKATGDGIPTTHADIKPSGIMDLHLVKQQLKGYEGEEVSHIANMLKGEKHERTHRTRLETETLIYTENETTTTTEESLETSDRFEMQRESKTTLDEETAVKGSLTVKGKYGPTVSFQASGEASWKRKSQESASAASEFARTVTQKASQKISERVLHKESLRINRQVEDIDQHTFDNTAGTDHVSGIYQWVTKIYEAQIFNYGPRTIYDIMVPEPGAFLLESYRRRRTAALDLEKPPAFEITPDELDEDNYQTYITLYHATDVLPPPEPFITESYDFNTGGEDKDQEFTNSTRIKIPDGFEAVRATIGSVVAVWDNWSVDVIIGQRSHRFESGDWVWTTSLDEESGSVPFAMVTDLVGDVAIALEVICEGTERALDLWRAETHAKLVQAYRTRLSEYEAKLAELETEAPDEIDSGPAARNRAIMIDEVKRACISVLTEQHFDRFDAIDNDTQGLPQINFGEADLEGPYVRFFEQAFEWENLSWVAYSYFWGRKSGWLDKIVIEDDDADFEAFLKAGYVRVQIPIRPGFVDAVDHFRIFGDTWQGGSLPAISDDTYLPIAEELAEKLGRPGNETPVDAPWDVHVPTRLVKLRSGDTLPKWEKQADGTWAEA